VAAIISHARGLRAREGADDTILTGRGETHCKALAFMSSGGRRSWSHRIWSK
jgi:hypothetical protein